MKTETSSTRLGDERLLKLAEFLGKVPAKHFNINWYVRNTASHSIHWEDDISVLQSVGKSFTEHECGAAACGIGWCPIVFPKQWKWDRQLPELRRGSEGCFPDAQKFFCLNDLESSRLFTERRDNRTPTALAAKIRKFVEGRQR